jgi:hypothetical protein
MYCATATTQARVLYAMQRDAPDMHPDAALRRAAIGTEELPRMMVEVAFLPLYTAGTTALLLDQWFGAHTFPMMLAFFTAMGEAAQVDLLSLQAAVRPSLPEISPLHLQTAQESFALPITGVLQQRSKRTLFFHSVLVKLYNCVIGAQQRAINRDPLVPALGANYCFSASGGARPYERRLSRMPSAAVTKISKMGGGTTSPDETQGSDSESYESDESEAYASHRTQAVQRTVAAQCDTRCRRILCNHDHHDADCPQRNKQQNTQRQRDLRARQRARGSDGGKRSAAKSDGPAGWTDRRRGVAGKKRRKK